MPAWWALGGSYDRKREYPRGGLVTSQRHWPEAPRQEMLTKASCEQRTSAGDGGTTPRHLQALLPSRAALSPKGYHVLSSACRSNMGQNFLTVELALQQ